MAAQSKFAAQVAQFSAKAIGATDDTIRNITLELFNGIISDSPVDTGRFRGNWQTTQGSPAQGELDRLDKNGTLAKAEVKASMGGLGSHTIMANNLPYAEVLEYGLYGTGPGATIKTTRDGYSLQAPDGMVRINFARITSTIQKSIRANKA